MTVSCHAGVRSRAQVLCMISQYSEPLSYLSISINLGLTTSSVFQKVFSDNNCNKICLKLFFLDVFCVGNCI